MRAVDDEPGSQSLARLFLEHGDGPGALRACALWREREPDCPEIPAYESQARAAVGPPRPLAVDQAYAERYVQRGLVLEALEIYRRLAAMGSLDEEGLERLALIEAFSQFELPLDADPGQLSAEEHIGGSRLSSALIDYRDLARRYPTDEAIIRRADQLRSLVLGVPWSLGSAALPQELARTAEMPLETQALLMVKEGNLRVAAQLFQVAAGRQDADPSLLDLASALERLADLAARDPLATSTDGDGTARLGPMGFAAFHVRVGNYVEAAGLYRSLLDQQPANAALRRRLVDVEAVVGYLRREGGASPEPERSPAPRSHASRSPAPGSPAPGSPAPKRRGVRPSQVGSGGSKQPDPRGALGKRSGAYELSAFRAPDGEGEPSGAGPTPEPEPTKRVDKRELAEIQLARGFVDRALLLFDELLAERPDDVDLAARVADLRARFATALVPEEAAIFTTQVDRPAARSAEVEDLRPKIDAEALIEVLRSAPAEAEPLRSAGSWLPTQRVQTLPAPQGLDEVPTEVKRRWARTQLSRPPTVEEDEGSSIVEVPRNLTSVVERTPGRLDADEAAEIGEPLGVLVRPVFLIE